MKLVSSLVFQYSFFYHLVKQFIFCSGFVRQWKSALHKNVATKSLYISKCLQRICWGKNNINFDTDQIDCECWPQLVSNASWQQNYLLFILRLMDRRLSSSYYFYNINVQNSTGGVIWAQNIENNTKHIKINHCSTEVSWLRQLLFKTTSIWCFNSYYALVYLLNLIYIDLVFLNFLLKEMLLKLSNQT